MTGTASDGGGRTRDAVDIAAGHTAIVAAVFCAVVMLLMLANGISSRAVDPLKAHRLSAMQVKLNREPQNETLRREVWRLDRSIRTGYFRSRWFALQGAYLLAAGVVVYLLALEVARRRQAQVPVPRPDAPERVWVESLAARRSVTALAALLGATVLTLSVLGRHDLSAEYARQAASGWAGPRTGPERNGVRVQVATAPAPGPVSGGLPPLSGSSAGAGTPLTPVQLPPAPSGGLLSTGGTALQPLPVPAPSGQAGARPGTDARPRSGPPVRLSPISVPGGEEQWPQFRGPGGAGEAPAAEPPLEWDAVAGKGVVWKAAVPLPGHNSPIVWRDRVLLAGADKARREIYCFATDDGRLLWRCPVPQRPGGKEVKVSADTGYCPATMATNGQLAFCIFADGVIAGADLNGRLVWTRDLGPLENHYGHASSLVVYGNGVIVQLDQGTAPEDGKSKLLALDAATGKTVWQIERPVAGSWSSPVLVRAGKRDLLIAVASPFVMAYDPRSGAEVWRAEVIGGEVAPAPAYGSGLIYAVNLGSNLAAIRPDGSGDVTRTHVVWLGQENLPDIVSPLHSDGLLFLCTSDGLVTCLEATTGAKVWEHALDAPVHSSPVAAQKRVYLTDTEGRTTVFEVGRSWKALARNALGEPVHATPALVGERIFLRGEKHLYCLGK